MWKTVLASKQASNVIIDIIKIIASILIIGSHSLPIFHSEKLNYFYGQWFFRFCVPFFMIVTGYYFSKADMAKRKSQIKKIAMLYMFSTLLYSPFIIRNVCESASIMYLVKIIVYGYHHLWYLIAVAAGLVLWLLFERVFGKHSVMLAAMPFLIIGIILDEYCAFLDFPIIDYMQSVTNRYLGGARNGMFFAFPMLCCGKFIQENEDNIKRISSLTFWFVMLILTVMSYLEAAYLLSILGNQVTLDVSIFGWTPAVFLFIIAIKINAVRRKRFLGQGFWSDSIVFRKISTVIYIVHPLILFVLNVFGLNYWKKFLICILISIIVSVWWILVQNFIKENIINKRKGN